MSLPRIALQRSGIVEEWEKEDDPRRIAYMGKRQARLEQVDGTPGTTCSRRCLSYTHVSDPLGTVRHSAAPCGYL